MDMPLTCFDRLVIDSISPLEPERKCFRMVGGVLVERTIKEVLPALETNYSGVSIIGQDPLFFFYLCS
jgi:prefoldin subunit 2